MRKSTPTAQWDVVWGNPLSSSRLPHVFMPVFPHGSTHKKAQPKIYVVKSINSCQPSGSKCATAYFLVIFTCLRETIWQSYIFLHAQTTCNLQIQLIISILSCHSTKDKRETTFLKVHHVIKQSQKRRFHSQKSCFFSSTTSTTSAYQTIVRLITSWMTWGSLIKSHRKGMQEHLKKRKENAQDSDPNKQRKKRERPWLFWLIDPKTKTVDVDDKASLVHSCIFIGPFIQFVINILNVPRRWLMMTMTTIRDGKTDMFFSIHDSLSIFVFFFFVLLCHSTLPSSSCLPLLIFSCSTSSSEYSSYHRSFSPMTMTMILCWLGWMDGRTSSSISIYNDPLFFQESFFLIFVLNFAFF